MLSGYISPKKSPQGENTTENLNKNHWTRWEINRKQLNQTKETEITNLQSSSSVQKYFKSIFIYPLMPLISSTHTITHMRQPYDRWVYVSWLCVFQQWLVVQDCIYFHNSFYNLIFQYTWFLHHSVPPQQYVVYFIYSAQGFQMWHIHISISFLNITNVTHTHFYLISEHHNQISALVLYIQEVQTATLRIFMVYSSHSSYMLETYLQLGQYCSLPYPFQFIKYWSSYH